MARRTKPQLRKELLEFDHFTDKQLEQLGDIASTRELQFRPGSVFPQRGLRHLQRLPHLRLLGFENSELSARQLADIGRCAALRRLDLRACRFPASALAGLERLPELAGLWLEGTAIGDGGLSHVARLAGLEQLVLSGTRVTDKGLKKLVRLPGLRELVLRDTAVTDAGMLALAAAPKVELAEGYVRGTSVTLAGIEAALERRRQAERRQRAAPAAAQPEGDPACAVVLDFIRRMQRWERAAARLKRKGAPFAELLAGQREVFARCCTVRERKDGRFGSFADPPEYDPEAEELLQAERRGRRVDVLTRRCVEQDPDELRLYAVVEQGGRWLVDGVQTSHGGAFRPGVL